MLDFNQTHLEPFQTMARPGTWDGHDFVRFSSRFPLAVPQTAYSQIKLTREILKQAAGLPESEVSSQWLTRAVLAWGGLRYGAIKNVSAHEGGIAEIVSTLRQRGLSRKEAFNAFSALASKKRIGMGPAYFTKLIFFADPRHDGYIMDQWTAKSVNLLSVKPIIKIYGNWVSPTNTGETYETFCTVIENLANHMKAIHPEADGEFVETCMFAGSTLRAKKDGTGGPLPWRRYVIQHWLK